MEKAYKKVLALDSSGLVASVAVVEGDASGSTFWQNIQLIIRRRILRLCFLCWTPL